MSVFEMIQCDNPGCKHTTTQNKMDGWISIEEDKSDYCEGRSDYIISQMGRDGIITSTYDLYDKTHFCCTQCFIDALGLKK